MMFAEEFGCLFLITMCEVRALHKRYGLENGAGIVRAEHFVVLIVCENIHKQQEGTVELRERRTESGVWSCLLLVTKCG